MSGKKKVLSGRGLSAGQLFSEMLQQLRSSASSPGVGMGRRGWSEWCWMGWSWSVPSTGISFRFYMGLTFPRVAKSELWITA